MDSETNVSREAAALASFELFEASCAAVSQKQGGAFAVLTLGLDRFKALNSTLGHTLGDEILALCRGRLLSGLRGEDKLLRLSGDEFALLVGSIPNRETASVVADRLKDLLQRPFVVRGQVVNLTACVGIALSPEAGNEAEDLLKRSGIALRSAKTAGPGTTQLFESAMEQQSVLRHALSVDLRKALLLQQFELYYQPQADTRTRRLIGFEALLRWKHPERGWISPAEFIPMAEDIGVINMIGDWVLRTACRQAAQLPPELVVAVNVSPIQLRSGTFLTAVQRALANAKIPGNRIEIEITEGVLVDHSAAVISTLLALQKIGVRLAMDDFGTGYSSLIQLAKLPFDTIKIDRSLVGRDARQRAIVRSVVALGAGLGIPILIEGIETEEELADVQADGCQFVQGYLLGRPAPVSELPGILARFQADAEARAEMRATHVAGCRGLPPRWSASRQPCFLRARRRRGGGERI